MGESVISTNQVNLFIIGLLKEGDLSEEALKRLFRTYSKQVHPDLADLNQEAFIALKQQYDDAREWLQDRLKGRQVKEPKPLDKKKLRFQFYTALNSYKNRGLFSTRLRLTPQLQKRNQTFFQEVLLLGTLYDKDFSTFFKKIHENQLESFISTKEHKFYRLGKNSFLQGLSSFFDYQSQGLKPQKRVALSYLRDAEDQLSMVVNHSFSQAYLEFYVWLLKELEKPPLKQVLCL